MRREIARQRWAHRTRPVVLAVNTQDLNFVRQSTIASASPLPRPKSPCNLVASLMPTAALFPEHTRIVAEQLHSSHDDPLGVGMRGIDQPVVFVGCEYRGHQ